VNGHSSLHTLNAFLGQAATRAMTLCPRLLFVSPLIRNHQVQKHSHFSPVNLGYNQGQSGSQLTVTKCAIITLVRVIIKEKHRADWLK